MLLICTKKINHRKRVISSAIALIIIASSIVGAVFTAPIYVYALSLGGLKSSIASLIISLFLQCGVAPVNTNYLAALNSSYGYTIETAISEGLLTETASGLVDTGLSSAIEGASAYTELGLADIFTTTVDDVGVVAASGAVNIANTAISVGTLGTIGAFAGAAAVGVGAGILINHLANHFKEYIKNAMAIDSSIDAMKYVDTYGGNVSSVLGVNDYTKYYYYPDNVVMVSSPSSATERTLYYADYKRLNGNVIIRYYDKYGKFYKQYRETCRAFTNPNGSENVTPAGYIYDTPQNVIEFNDIASQQEFIKNLREGNTAVPNKISPDLIGPIGNQFYDNELGNSPGISNQIPEGADMIPVNMDDYNNFVDAANQNTADGNTGQPVQGEGFDNIIDPLIVNAPVIPDKPIIPDQPVDVPTVPDRPIVPDQPTVPDKPGITQEQLDQALQGATTIDLRSIFPFCIPFDIYNLLLIFDTGENRKAPHINFVFPVTGWQIDVDLEPFNPVASILRLLELILFIVGLAVATRKLIGAGGN